MELIMEKRDQELIDQLLPKNDELQKLVKEHKEFESQLGEFSKRLYLSDEENREKKRIQKLKLAGRDRIEQILRDHRAKGKVH
jgi:GAT domain.